MSDQERLEDVFDREIIEGFYSNADFFQFARSKDGLKLHQHEITNIQEDNCYRVREQKLDMLNLWKQKQGARASPSLIREVYGNYIRRDVSVSSDAVKDTSDNPPVVVQEKDNREGPSTVNITNIQGPIQGQVIMGNEQVLLGGATAAGNPLIDPDVPLLKPSNSGISPEKCAIRIGGCKLKFPPHSVKDAAPIDLFYKVDPSPPPDGHVHASAVLSCSPPFQGQKSVKVTLPTWCSTGQSTDVGIFAKDSEGNWRELDRPVLTHEGHLELHYRQLDNLAAFLSKEQLENVEFKISCFLFNNADGKFAMAFCLSDQAIENVLLYRLKKENYVCTVKNLEPLNTLLGDEIHFQITPGQQMRNTRFKVDEQFVSSFQGHVTYCKINKNAGNPVYKITQKRRYDGELVVRKSYDIEGNDSGESVVSESTTTIAFHGDVDAENFLGQVEDVDIDMRNMGDGDCSNPFWEENKLTYEEKKKKREDSSKLSVTIKKKTGGSPTNVECEKKEIAIHGNLKARNIIAGARNVRIDQRTGMGKKPKLQTGSKLERLVIPEQEQDSPESVHNRREFQESSDVTNEAKPIWKDCEKMVQDEKKDTTGSESSRQQLRYTEKAGTSNEAEPISGDCEKNDGNRDGRGDETDESGSFHDVPEVDVRQRKMQKKKGDTKKEANDKKEADPPINNSQLIFAIGLVLCAMCALYYFSK